MLKTNFFNTDIIKIYISLGSACDLRCKYCYHNTDERGFHDDIEDINEDVVEWIREIAKRQTTMIEVRFIGGEPLVYFNKVKHIVEELRDVTNIYFAMITNGKAIDEERAKFINDNNIWVILSWDGHYISQKYRGYDVFKENGDNINKLLDVQISCTFVDPTKIVDVMEDLREVSTKYSEATHRVLKFAWTPIDDIGSHGEFLNDLYEIENNQIGYMCELCKEGLMRDQMTPFDFTLMTAFEEDLLSIDRDFDGLEIASGSDLPNTYTVDLEGNLYRYHQFGKDSKDAEVIGNIYMSYYEYMANYVPLMMTDFKDMRIGLGCRDCYVKYLCHGPGPKVCKESLLRCCKTRYAIYEPVCKLVEWFAEWTEKNNIQPIDRFSWK